MAATDDKSYLTTIAVAFAVAMTAAAVILRFWARLLHKVAIGADDYFIVVGAVFTVANALMYLWVNRYGNGRHVDTISTTDFVLYWRTFYMIYQIYGIAITAIKLSVLLFYRRVFSAAQFRKRINVVGGLVIAWLFGNNIAAFQCSPVHKAWELDVPGKCLNPLIMIQVVQAFNGALDIAILALPVLAVSKLQMSRGREIGVLAIFLLGGLSVLIAFIRLAILTTQSLDDVTYSTGKCSWTAVEPAVEVVSACLLTMAPLLDCRVRRNDLRPRRLLQPLTFRRRSNKGHSDSYSLASFATPGNRNYPPRNKYERKVGDNDDLSYNGETLRALKGGDMDIGGRRGKESLDIHTRANGATFISAVSSEGPERVANVGPTGRGRQLAQDERVANGDDDIFPLKGMLVKQDMNWTESRKENMTKETREAGVIV